MKKFEDFMQENSGNFDREEGGKDLWQGVEEKLERRGRFLWTGWLRVAAVFLLGVITTTVYFMNTNEDRQRESIVRAVTLADLAPEYADVESYYMKTISQKVNDVQQYNLDQYPESKDFMTHYQRVDSIYKDLMTEMTHKGADQRIIDELILNYKIKIKILEALKKQLETQGVGQKKTTEDSKGV